jgi:hypothetical protein
MKNYFFLIALILCSLTACKKDKDINGTGTPPPQQQQLPPITTEGKNTFGCLVNGEVWLPEVKPYQMFIYSLTSSYEFGNALIIARKSIKNGGVLVVSEGVTLSLYNFYQQGFIELSPYSGSAGQFRDGLADCTFVTDSVQKGSVNILKLDTVQKIISGTFEFTVGKLNCDTVRITDGRFDVKYAN